LFWLENRSPGSLETVPGEGVVLTALDLPALIDWIRGRIKPRSGSNALRVLTGTLLGVGLARLVHLQATAPFEQPAVDVIIVLVVGVAVGEIMARAIGDEEEKPSAERTAGIDPERSSDVTSDRGPGDEAG
ncbi:MAG: hypothetical protein ACOCVR_05035, partial [Myxococcota bacterium]